jgi:hypothetical protein
LGNQPEDRCEPSLLTAKCSHAELYA